MCGRFNVSDTPGLQDLLSSLGLSITLPPPRFNIAPTESVDLVASFDDATELRSARWWLTPSWSKGPDTRYAMFNARAEGLAKSPAYRKPFASQRGVVPVSSFIEWRTSDGIKRPWRISNEGEALALAALWDVWCPAGDGSEPLLSCTLVTTEAAEAFRPWHHRMPVMLTPESIPQWLGPEKIGSESALFSARLCEPLHLVPLDTAVGNSRNKAPESMEPVGDTVVLPATPQPGT